MNKQTRIHKKKRRYQNSVEAWSWAEYYFVVYGDLFNVYRYEDRRGVGYYLTTAKKVGDLSHIPPESRQLFATYKQPPAKRSFWKRLRLLLCENEKEKDSR